MFSTGATTLQPKLQKLRQHDFHTNLWSWLDTFVDIFPSERCIGGNSPKRRGLRFEPVVDEGKVREVRGQKSQQRSKETTKVLLFLLRLLQQILDRQLCEKLWWVGFGQLMVCWQAKIFVMQDVVEQKQLRCQWWLWLTVVNPNYLEGKILISV